MFAALSENYGNLKDKLNLFVALAPVVRLDNAYNDMIVSLAQNVNQAQFWMSTLGIDEVFGPEWQDIAFRYCPAAPREYREMCYGEKFLNLHRRVKWNDTIVPMED